MKKEREDEGREGGMKEEGNYEEKNGRRKE